MIYEPVKDMHGKHLLEDMMTAYQSVSQSCLDMRTLDYASSGCGQIGNDQLYGGDSAVSETPVKQVSRAHSVGDLSTGLTLSLVGQRKADSMLNLTAVPLHNIQESIQSAFDSHPEVNGNSAESAVKHSQMIRRQDRSKNPTNYSSPRQRSPLKGKRTLPNVPVSEASERIKRFTELMNARMALHSSASLHTTTPLSPGGGVEDIATPLVCSDSEISDIFNRKVMIGDKSLHRGNNRESEYRMVHFDGQRDSSRVNDGRECKVQSVYSVSRGPLSPAPLPGHSAYQCVSSPKFQNHLFEPVVPSSMQPGIRVSDQQFHARCGDSAREKPITSSQLAHYQEMVAALNNRQTESTYDVNVINNEFTRNLYAYENHAYNSVKSRPLSSQLVGSFDTHVSVGMTRTDQSGRRDNFTCENSNIYDGNNKRFYGSQPNLNISQVKKNSVTSGHTFLSLGHSQTKLQTKRMERDHVNDKINHALQSSTFSPIALSTVTPNSSRRKTFQFPSNIELSGEAYRYSTLPGKWRPRAEERGGSEGFLRKQPTLYQLAQVCSFHSCRVSLPPGLALQQCVYLTSQVLQLPALNPSPPNDKVPGCGPQGPFTASIGGPGSAFRPVHRSTSSTIPISFVSVQQVTDGVLEASLPVSKGDVIVEMNGVVFLGADEQFVKKTMYKAQGEIFLTVARVKNHDTSLTVEQMMNEIDFLRAEIAERDYRLREMEARLGSFSPEGNTVPNEEVEISEDEFIV